MANRVQLSLVIHNHQPVGNFDQVIEQACDRAYLPFLRMVERFPAVRIGLHTSGCLWEWLEAHRKEYGELVAELVRRGQVELLGGGMYEPILPVLLRRDGFRQLDRMNSFIEQRFGVRPQGMWCPERVWEPHLPALLAGAGLKYTLLDDYHFRGSALPRQIETEYFLTAHANATIALLPISQKLRYTMPFKPVPDTIEHLQTLAGNADAVPLCVFGDDGEKFGVWPETYEWVYGKHWLENFLSAVTDNTGWIDVLLPSEVLFRRKPAGTVYIPCASYSEMGEWTRVDPDAGEDDPPGFWRNYFHKYPESEAMYQRTLMVSELLEEARRSGVADAALADAADDLGRSQCNCAYWHGVFGGLYLNYLRQAVSYHLLKAETAIRRVYNPGGAAEVRPLRQGGMPWEGYELRNERVTAIVEPMRGLCLTRLDSLPTFFCLSDVLARRREAYHRKLEQATPQVGGDHESIHDRVVAKEEGLSRLLVVDPHPRVGANSFFSDLSDPAQLLRLPGPGEQAPSRLHDDYFVAARDVQRRGLTVAGTVDLGGFTLSKSLTLEPTGLKCAFQLACGALPAEDGEFFVEFNLTALTDKAPDRYLEVGGRRFILSEAHDFREPAEVSLVDEWQGKRLRVAARRCTRIVCYPVYTVSSSEGGFERTYQGTCVLVGYNPSALVEGIVMDLIVEDARGRNVQA